MVESIVRQQTLACMSRHLALQSTVGDKTDSIHFTDDSTKDIFGQDRSKLKSVESAKYFVCDNCTRKIAGGRFAQHVNKCLTRTRK